MSRKIVFGFLPLLSALAFAPLIACGGGGTTIAPSEAPPTRAVAPNPPEAVVVVPGLNEATPSTTPFFKVQPTPTPETGTKLDTGQFKQYPVPPPMTIDPKKSYTATIELEKGGEIVIKLHADKAPRAVNSFVFLARDGFYDGLTFFKVTPGDRAQTGDPKNGLDVVPGYGTGFGGPGYTFDDEFTDQLRHDKPGVVSMDNRGIQRGSGTNGSQFFITHEANNELDGLSRDGGEKQCPRKTYVDCHTVFGQVIGGMDIVRGLTPRDPNKDTFKGDVVKTIRITEK